MPDEKKDFWGKKVVDLTSPSTKADVRVGAAPAKANAPKKAEAAPVKAEVLKKKRAKTRKRNPKTTHLVSSTSSGDDGARYTLAEAGNILAIKVGKSIVVDHDKESGVVSILVPADKCELIPGVGYRPKRKVKVTLSIKGGGSENLELT